MRKVMIGKKSQQSLTASAGALGGEPGNRERDEVRYKKSDDVKKSLAVARRKRLNVEKAQGPPNNTT